MRDLDPAAYLAALVDADGCVFTLSVREAYEGSPAGLAVKRRRREQTERARALKDQGATLEQIGADLGISISTASRRLAA